MKRRPSRKRKSLQKRKTKSKTLKKRSKFRRVAKPAAKSFVVKNNGVFKTIRLQHKEFLFGIDTKAELNYLTTYEVNPGLPSMFPWLSGLAKLFETYTFHRLSFEYIPAVGTEKSGSMGLAPDYDAADDNTTLSKHQVLAFEDSIRGPLWEDFALNCSKSNLRKDKLFVRQGPLSSNLDIKMYDNLQLLITRASNEIQQEVGELWVSYDISFHTPQLDNYDDLSTFWYVEATQTGGTQYPFNTITEVINDLGVERVPTNNTFITLPGDKTGSYLVSILTDTGGTNNDVNAVSVVPKINSYFESTWETISTIVYNDFVCLLGIWTCLPQLVTGASFAQFAIQVGLTLVNNIEFHDWIFSIDKLDENVATSLIKTTRLKRKRKMESLKTLVTDDSCFTKEYEMDDPIDDGQPEKSTLPIGKTPVLSKLSAEAIKEIKRMFSKDSSD